MNAKVKPDAGKLLELASDYAVERSPDLLRVVANFANRDMMRDCIAREIARAYVAGAISAVDIALTHIREEAARQGVKLRADFGTGL